MRGAEKIKQYHIACKQGDLAPYLLMPGDPGRVLKIAKTWDSYKEIAFNRQFKSATGSYSGAKLSCLSTGIGAPGVAIALEEAARIGVHTFIRVGSTGALRKDMKPGDLVINTAGVKLEGTSKNYVREGYPASTSYEVTLALIEACERLKLKYHLGIVASTDSFYVGEGQAGFNGYNQSYLKDVLNDLIKANVINVEMEASALFTIANLYGFRAGSICAVSDNLVTKQFAVLKGEDKLAEAASLAVKLLYEWDKLKQKRDKKYFYPSLR